MNKYAEKFPNVFITQGLIDLEAYGLTDTKPKLRVIAQINNPNKLHFRHEDIDGEEVDDDTGFDGDMLSTNDLVGDNIPQLTLDDIDDSSAMDESPMPMPEGMPMDESVTEPTMPEWKQQLEEWLRANKR